MNPETELLLCCARTQLNSETTERIHSLVCNEIDWEYLVQISLRHGVMPLLYQGMKKTCPQAMPADTLEQLRTYFLANGKRNLFLTGKLLKLLELLKKHDIFAIPYKGPILAEALYGNIALRQFTDLDILVHKNDVIKTKELLLSQGYQSEYKLSRVQEAAYLDSKFEYMFDRNDHRVYLEIHWQIVPRYFSLNLDVERFWGRLETISICNRNTFTLSPEDLLLVLCVHGARHLWQRLAWVCDVAELISFHKNFDWEWIMRQATMLGSERILFLGIYLASDLLGAAIPEKISRKVQADPVVRSLAGQVSEWLFKDYSGRPKGLEYCLFHTKARERIRDKIQYYLRLIITPNVKDWAFLPTAQFFLPLYYIIRPVRLAKDYLLRPLRRLWQSI